MKASNPFYRKRVISFWRASARNYPERSDGSRRLQVKPAPIIRFWRASARNQLITDHEADGSEKLWNHLPPLFLILPRYPFPWIDQMLGTKGKPKEFLSIALSTEA